MVPPFLLNGITLAGNTAIPDAELAPTWTGLVGEEVTVGMLSRVAARISAAYRERGYVLSQAVVPVQTVEDGIVRIVVVEGFVDDVSLTGGAASQRAIARRLFAPVPREGPAAPDARARRAPAATRLAASTAPPSRRCWNARRRRSGRRTSASSSRRSRFRAA